MLFKHSTDNTGPTSLFHKWWDRKGKEWRKQARECFLLQTAWMLGLQAAASIVKTKAVICPFTGTFYSGVSWHLCRICKIISALAAALFVLVWVPLTVRCPTAYSIFRNCGLCGGRNGVYVQETKCCLCVSWGEKERATERHRQTNSMWKFLRACVYVCVCVHADCTYTSARSKLAFHLIVWGHTKLIDAGLDLLFIPSIHPSITAKEREGEEKKTRVAKQQLPLTEGETAAPVSCCHWPRCKAGEGCDWLRWHTSRICCAARKQRVGA